jgi:hypothetical protein
MNDLLDEMQIILDCDPRYVNDKGVEQPTDHGEATGAASKPKPAVKAAAELSAWQRDAATRIFRS